MTNTAKIILGIVGAAAAGAIIGILVAPEKGSETRKKMKDTANDWADQLSDLFTEGKSELNNLRNKAAKTAATAKAEAENMFNDVKESFS